MERRDSYIPRLSQADSSASVLVQEQIDTTVLAAALLREVTT